MILERPLNPYSHTPHILEAREVVMWTPSYQRVIITSTVLDRNGDITVQTEDGSSEGVKLDKLIWVENFSQSSPITHDLRSCMVPSKDAGRFTGVRL